MEYTARQPADGYTFVVGNLGPAGVNPLLTKLPYDSVRDLAPVVNLASSAAILVVHPSVPARALKEFIALAKQRPGQLTSASSGIGSTGHVATEIFSRQAGVKMLNIQYKGAAPAVIDLVGGHVMLRFDQVLNVLLRAIAKPGKCQVEVKDAGGDRLLRCGRHALSVLASAG